MASAQQHYREAERLLAGQPKTAADRELGIAGAEPWPPTQMELLEAQVHATLAVAAVQAEATLGRAVVLDPDGPDLRPHQGPS